MWYLGKLEFSQHFGAMKIHAAMFKLDGLFDNARGAVYAKGEGGEESRNALFTRTLFVNGPK